MRRWLHVGRRLSLTTSDRSPQNAASVYSLLYRLGCLAPCEDAEHDEIVLCTGVVKAPPRMCTFVGLSRGRLLWLKCHHATDLLLSHVRALSRASAVLRHRRGRRRRPGKSSNKLVRVQQVAKDQGPKGHSGRFVSLLVAELPPYVPTFAERCNTSVFTAGQSLTALV